MKEGGEGGREGGREGGEEGRKERTEEGRKERREEGRNAGREGGREGGWEGSKIPQDSWEGILDSPTLDPPYWNSIWPQYFDMALPESKISPRSPVQSWILDPPY